MADTTTEILECGAAVMAHPDLAYVVVNMLVARRCDPTLICLRAASKRMRELVDRAWRLAHAEFDALGLPVPRLRPAGNTKPVQTLLASVKEFCAKIDKRSDAQVTMLLAFAHCPNVPYRMDFLYTLVQHDCPEAVRVLMPTAWRIIVTSNLLLEHNRFLYAWRNFIANARTKLLFLRWAPFFYRLFPMVEADAHTFLNAVILDGRTFRTRVIAEGNRHLADWIEANWTEQHKQACNKLDKWWIQKK